jgi:hypothetical protein
MLSPHVNYPEKKMSQTQIQTTRKTMATRTVVLLLVIVGLSAGAAAFAFASVSANTPTQTSTSDPNFTGQWLGLRGAGPLGWHAGNRSFTRFGALSTLTNVSVTGFSIVDSTHLTVNLAYHGTGTSPALTIVVVAPGLSGSNTEASGWTSPSSLSINLVGSGNLTADSTWIRVLVVPLTGA